MIFVVDDNQVILRTLEVTLAHLGQVRVSTLWSEVASLVLRATNEERHLLICDLEMPGIRGDEFCRIVRKYNPSLPIMLFTGSPERAPTDVADVVVDKAKGPEELVRHVELILGTRQQRRVAR